MIIGKEIMRQKFAETNWKLSGIGVDAKGLRDTQSQIKYKTAKTLWRSCSNWFRGGNEHS